MVSNAEPVAAKQPNHGSNVAFVIDVNAEGGVDAEPSSYIKRQDLGKTNNAASSNLSSGESRTKPFNWDGIEKKARKAKENGIFQRRLTDARQDEISKSLEVVEVDEVDEVDAKAKTKKAAAEDVRRPAHAFKASPEKDVEEDESIATPKKKTKKEERLAQRKKQRQERDREGTKTQRPRSQLSAIIQPPLLRSEDASGEDANSPLPQNKSVSGKKIASQRIASEPLHNEPPGSTTIIHDLPLTNNYSWPSMGLGHPTLSTSSTNANTLPPTGAMGLAFNVFPKDVKGLPSLKILGTTDPAGELQYKVYGTKFHCQWRLLVHHNAREPLDSKCNDDNPWGIWAEGEKWIKEDITIMRTHDEKSDQRAEGLSDRRFELPLDLFKDKKPNEDGSINYRFPQQFQINVVIEPLFSADHTLSMNRPENLSDTAKDAIRNGNAKFGQVRMMATAVVHSKYASHVVECDLRTYLTDISTIPENMSAEACRTERMRRCSEAFRTTQRLTPFRLAIAIEWPSWCKQPELARSMGCKGKSVALQREQENGHGAEVEVPGSVWPQALVNSTGSRAHMALSHIRALSQNTIIPAAESDMLAVSGTFLSTSQYGSTAPSFKNGGNSPREKLTEATARPAETITTTKDNAKASGTPQGGEALLSTIEDVLDDVEHNGSWAPGQDVPDVVTESLEALTLSPVAVDGPQLCDRPHANGDGMGLPVPTSQSLGLQTAVKDGIAKPTQGSAPIPQLGTIAHPAALASAHITGSPRHGKKKSFVPSVEIKPTGLRKDISTLHQGSVDAAKSVEIIDLVSDDEAAPAPASRPLCPQTTVQCGIVKPTENSTPNPLGRIATLAAIASAHIPGSPQNKVKDVFKRLLGHTSIDLQKDISTTLAQGNAEAAKAVEVIDFVGPDNEATVLSTKAAGKNGIPRSFRRAKRSQTGNPSVSSKDFPKQISGYPLLSKSLKRSFIPSPTKPSSAHNPSSAMPTHQTLKSIDQTSEPLAPMPSAASNLSSNGAMPNPPTWIASPNLPDKYFHHSRKVLPSSNQVTVGPSAALRESSEQRPPSITCYWIMVNERGYITTKSSKIAQCHICKVIFSEFWDLRDHLESGDSHPDRSIKIRYDKDGNKCHICVRLPLVGDPPFAEKMLNEDTQNSKRVSGWPRSPDESSLSVSSTPFVAGASSAIRRQSPQALQKGRTSKASQLRPLSSANPATLHKRCKWSSITWDNAWIEENDDTSRCILCNKQFPSFEKLRSHLETDIIHCGSSITIAYDPDSTGCRILTDQLKWVNCDNKTQTIFEEVSAPGKRTRIRRSIGSNGTINVNDDVSLHKRVEATKMTCFWVVEDDIKENNGNECLRCRERFATFADLRWHLADSTTDDHDGFRVKIMYSLDGLWCQINVSKRHYPEDTESYRHGFDEVFPDGLDMWQTITETRPETYDKLKRHTDTTLLRSASQQVSGYKVNDVSCKWKFWPCHWGEEAPEQISDSGQCLICLKECGSFRGLRDHLMHDNVWHRWCVTILYGDDPLKVEICLENMPTLGLFFERKSKTIGVSSSHPSVLQRPQYVQRAKRPLTSASYHSPVKPVYWDIDVRLRAKPGTCKTYRTYECIACHMDVFSTFEELQDHLLYDKEHENHTVLFAGPKGGDRCIKLSRRHSTQTSSKSPQSRTKSPTAIVSAVSEHVKGLPISPLHPRSPSVPQLHVGVHNTAAALYGTFIAASKSSDTTGLGNIQRQIASKKPAIGASHISDGTAISVAPNAIERCLNPAKNLYNREKLSVISLKDNRIGQEESFCKEDRERLYSPSNSSAADNDNGRDKLDYNDDGDEKKRWNSKRPAAREPNDSTESSAQESRKKSRQKSPKPQPRKKRRMTNDIEGNVAQDVILSDQAVVNLADDSEVAPPEGSGMSAPNKVQSSNAKRLANDELGPEHDRKRARLDGDTSRADTLSTEHFHQAAARNTHIAQQPIVAESSTEWHSPQPSHSKKAKQANGPCFECKAILSTRGWHHRLPHQKPPDDGAVWCKNCYARHYNKLERDGGPCFLCRKTRSKKWHHKLQDEERHGDGRMFCSKCYYQKSARRKTIILPETTPDSAFSEHEVAPSDET